MYREISGHGSTTLISDTVHDILGSTRLKLKLNSSTTNYYDCWCKFGKKSSGNAGDGPVSELSSVFLFYKFNTYVRNVSHPERDTQSCDHDKD